MWFSVGSGLHVNLGYIKTIEANNTERFTREKLMHLRQHFKGKKGKEPIKKLSRGKICVANFITPCKWW